MEDYIVTTKQGKLRGCQNKSIYSKCTYYSFCGIPYAKPPVEELRFRPPVPYGNWKGILDAQRERADCIHFAYLFKVVLGDEDCLYLNIHIPEFPPPKENLKKVIIHIHGGGYTLGSGNREYYGSPEYVMHKDIIYVNFNYRLHVLGFLNLEIPECPGNVGLKDIVLAMHWVKENIQAFGGDPDDITILGCSSSACAIHLLMLHPQYRQLFHKAIMLGSCLTNQAINYCENPVERARQFARVLGFFDPSPKKILRFLRKKTAEELVEGLNILRKLLLPVNRITSQHNLFIPSIEKFADGAILTENPLNLLHTIDPIPILFGICDLDGMQCFAQGSPINQLAENFTEAIELILWMYQMDDETLKNVANKIRKFYFGDKPIDEQMCREICHLYCDIWHAEDYTAFFDVIYNKNPNTPIYLYEFGFEGSFNLPKRVTQRHLPCVLEGADHGDDYFYWVCSNQNGNLTPNDTTVVEYIAEFFTNFAKFGNPNSDLTKDTPWERYTPDNASFMKINLKLQPMPGKWNNERTRFWEDLIKYIKSKALTNGVKKE